MEPSWSRAKKASISSAVGRTALISWGSALLLPIEASAPDAVVPARTRNQTGSQSTKAPSSCHPEGGCVAVLRGVHNNSEQAFTILRITCTHAPESAPSWAISRMIRERRSSKAARESDIGGAPSVRNIYAETCTAQPMILGLGHRNVAHVCHARSLRLVRGMFRREPRWQSPGTTALGR